METLQSNPNKYRPITLDDQRLMKEIGQTVGLLISQVNSLSAPERSNNSIIDATRNEVANRLRVMADHLKALVPDEYKSISERGH